MTQETEFFFDSIENSTELYREAPISKDYYLRSFFEEPTSNDLFIEVDASSEVEDSLFQIQEKFPSRFQNQFIRLVSKSSEKLEPTLPTKKQDIKTRTNKTIKRVKRIRKKKKIVKKKKIAKSEITKNACCNIVQKTISLIKKGEFNQKLEEICLKFKVDTEKFKVFIVNEKTRFTGTKALEKFLGEKSIQIFVFAEFLGWFLREKYIRYAITSGEMSNVSAYITFKNEVILPLL